MSVQRGVGLAAAAVEVQAEDLELLLSQPDADADLDAPARRWSSVASILACSSGWRCGTISTLKPRRTRCVRPAAQASSTNGS